LEKAKEFVRGRTALSLEDPFAVATWFIRQVLLTPEVLDPDETLARIDAVEARDIQRLAQTLFREERLNLAVVGPFDSDSESFRQAIQF
jgi:predicted Zn-dependent peptidase